LPLFLDHQDRYRKEQKFEARFSGDRACIKRNLGKHVFGRLSK